MNQIGGTVPHSGQRSGVARAGRIGMIHGLGNVVVVGLFIVSWLLRRDLPHTPSTPATVFSFAGIGLSLITGWLEGELVDRLGVGVDEGANLNAPSSLTAPHLPAAGGGGSSGGGGSRVA